MSAPKGFEIARQRIAEEAEKKTGRLDLRGVGLTEFPDELFGPELQHLTEFDCHGTQVSDLSALANLSSLQSLDCSGTQVSDLSALANLSSLQSLNCSETHVSDLSALANLSSLQSLDCRLTQVSDLSALANLSSLQSLDCSETQVSDLSALANLSSLQSLDCSAPQVSDLSALANLSSLQSLSCVGSQVSDLSALANLSSLQSLNCSATHVSDLSALANLSSLQWLRCSYTQVSDLSALANLSSLQSLDCRLTHVSDLSALANLSSLQSLNCSAPLVSDLSALANLSSLQSLNCSAPLVSDLSALAKLSSLQSLGCSNTQVSDLSALAKLSSLQSLSCSGTQVSDLSALAKLSSLQSLRCSYTHVSDLSALANLSSLQSLSCSGTQVSDLSALADIIQLKRIDADRCHLSDFPEALLTKNDLSVNLDEASIRGVPNEVLGRDCLDSIRAHVDDLKEGSELIPDVKLLVLGNGRIGKTQICNRMRSLPFEANADSTHGILITSTEMETSYQEIEETRLNLWDFGGQDLYHGTHSLFARAKAVFLVVWTPEMENCDSHETHGMVHQNRVLSWWLDYVKTLGGPDSAVLVVQNQCDAAADEWINPPCENDELSSFGFVRKLHYSAKNQRGQATFDEALREAIAHVRGREGIASIGKGRAEVHRQLLEWRDADAELKSSERKHRTVTQEEFLQLCEGAGNISSPPHVLEFLARCGVVFYREGLFGNRIILDQSWALDAIYSIFDRKSSYPALKQMRGRFTRPILESLVWHENGEGGAFTKGEQELFLSMMKQCGICFVHRGRNYEQKNDTEYIAPDLLPDRDDISGDLAGRWEDAPEGDYELSRSFLFPFLPPGHMRTILSHFGREAGVNAVYWRDGLYFFDQKNHAHCLIEKVRNTDGRGGRITVKTQGSGRANLLEVVWEQVEEINDRAGIHKVEVEGGPLRIRKEDTDIDLLNVILEESDDEGDRQNEKSKIDFQIPDSPPRDGDEFCVSYAWGPELSDDPTRAGRVEAFCKTIEEKTRCKIIRDCKELELNQRIADFERRIGRAERIYIFLSTHYVQSPHCMHELLMIWQRCQGQGDEFTKKVRVFRFDDVAISREFDRIPHAVFWKEKFEEMDALIRKHGAAIVSAQGLLEWKSMQKFYLDVSEMLAHIADMLRANDFGEFVAAAIKEISREGVDASE